jgi:hypothetical protein
VSKIVGEQSQKYLRCAAHERRRFLQGTDHNHLLARIPDVAGNCACRWSPVSDSASVPTEIDDSDDDQEAEITHQMKRDGNYDGNERQKRRRLQG